MPHGSCTVPGDPRSIAVRALAYMGGLAILAIAAASLFRDAPATPVRQAAVQPDWSEVRDPRPAFELKMPGFPAEAFHYAILRRNADGARQDVLSWGSAAEGRPYLGVAIERPGSAVMKFPDAPAALADAVGPARLAGAVAPAGTMDSKFGSLSLAAFSLAAPSGGAAAVRQCLGFARTFDQPAMQIAGWYCSPGDQPVDRREFACALDRLTIVSAGGDATLAGFFARADLKRTFCGIRNPILAATPERDVQVPIPRGIKLTRGAARRHPPPR